METARDKKKWGIFGNRSEIQIARDAIELLGSGGTRTMLILLNDLISTVGLAFEKTTFAFVDILWWGLLACFLCSVLFRMMRAM